MVVFGRVFRLKEKKGKRQKAKGLEWLIDIVPELDYITL